MNSKKTLLAALLAALMLTSGCGSSPSQQQTDTAAQTGETGTSNVASASDMAEVEDVVEDSMIPIAGDQVKDGTYHVTVKSSSKMFDITACELTVEGGKMTAVMHMGGTGYLYVYMGTGEQAAAASESDYIPFTEEADGSHSFTVPVDALDEGIDCAAFSKKKEKWYDRTILFRADSLPMDAFADGVVTTPADLGLADGTYTADVALAGGSGLCRVPGAAHRQGRQRNRENRLEQQELRLHEGRRHQVRRRYRGRALHLRNPGFLLRLGDGGQGRHHRDERGARNRLHPDL